jgi:hypothetical protein
MLRNENEKTVMVKKIIICPPFDSRFSAESSLGLAWHWACVNGSEEASINDEATI